MSIVERMFYLMEQKNIKSSELSEFLGVNKSVVSTWKKRNTNPPSEMLVKICELLNVSLNFLITGEELKIDNKLSKEEQYIIDLYRKLTARNQIKLEGYMEAEILRQNDQDNVAPPNNLRISLNSKQKKKSQQNSIYYYP